MNDYNKNYFRTEGTGKDRKYYFFINGVAVEVSKEVYNTCFSSYVCELRNNRRSQTLGIMSIDYEDEAGFTILDHIVIEEDILSEIYIKDQVEDVLEAMSYLSLRDRDIIVDLLINGKSEKELAHKYGISQQRVHTKKQQIIKKIRKILEKGLLKRI